MLELTWRGIVARRLERHGLAIPLAGGEAADAAAAMCGAHAQILTAAELSIGLRLRGATRADVRHALWQDHSLIKTFGPRGTVHLLPARDLAMWTGALGALPRGSGPFPEHVRMTPAQTEAVIAAIGDALEDAELTVDELTEEVVTRAGRWAGDLVMPAFQTNWPRWRQVTDLAAYRGVLCFGPNRGRNVTYTNPARWLPGFRPADAQTGLRWLLRTYLHAYGPATPRDLAQWLAVSPRWANGVVRGVRRRTGTGDRSDGEAAWVVTRRYSDSRRSAARCAAAAVLRCVRRWQSSTCPPLPRASGGERALAGSQAGNFPVLLIDGIVAGVWHQRRSGKKIVITVEPLNDLSAIDRTALDVEVERVGEIMEGRPELTIGPVMVGAHA